MRGIPSASDVRVSYRITRDARGRVRHDPPCRAYQFGRPCRHVARALALTETPLATLVGDLARTWPGADLGEEDLRAWAAVVHERVGSALASHDTRAAWLAGRRRGTDGLIARLARARGDAA